jgi:hypothetical protein
MESDLGAKVMKFFQPRGTSSHNNNNSKSEEATNKPTTAQPRLHLTDDEEEGEDPTAHTCSTISMNASWSPPQCPDHFVHCVCADKTLYMPEIPKTPISNQSYFVPLSHVTCSNNSSELPTSALASPRESPALSEGYTFRNPFSTIRCDQNVLRSLALPATERTDHRSLAVMSNKAHLSTARARRDEDQNDGRLYEC